MKRHFTKTGRSRLQTQVADQRPRNRWIAVYPLPALSNLLRKLVHSCTAKRKIDSKAVPWHAGDNVPTCVLCDADKLPNWHFKHRNVVRGYRCCNNFSSAFWSMFQWHNESINIWSHYIGTAALLLRIWYVIATDLAQGPKQVPSWFMATMTICLVFGNSTPFLFSAFCHHFYGVNQTWHRCCWFMDFTGLMTGVLGITTGHLLLVHQCQPQHFVATFLATLAPYVYFVYACLRHYSVRLQQPVLVPCDRFPEFSSNMTKFSAFAFTIALGSTMYFYPQYMIDPALHNIVIRVAMHPVYLVISIVIFAQGGVPERFTSQLGLPQGFFDFIGHSHQLWHVASWAILYMWLDIVVDHYRLRAGTTCPFLP